MICPRHRLPARGDHGCCDACFTEAITKAEDTLLERKLAAMRLTSADALIRRLGGTR